MNYRTVKQDGVELLVSPDLARNSENLHIKLNQFLFFRNLKAVVELTNGVVLGARAM
ncbi:MAG: hypothetical protein MK210_16425 [Dehalococcoidia bacterium]|nr:hypothetical protein [Dehalococcoidia bacterium]